MTFFFLFFVFFFFDEHVFLFGPFLAESCLNRLQRVSACVRCVVYDKRNCTFCIYVYHLMQ